MEKEIVLITGASSGFGYKTALHLAKDGYLVIATMRDLHKKEALLDEARMQNTLQNIVVLQLDVTNKEDLNDVKNVINSTYGRLDVLINNAGYCLGGMTEYVEMIQWEQQLNTNVLGVVATTKAFIPMMRKRRKGKIINIGSISGRFGFPGLGAYTTSKFALSGFSESLRLELAPFNVSVSLIEAGAFKTSIWDKSLEDVDYEYDQDYENYSQFITNKAKESAKQAEDPSQVIELIVKICRSKKPRFRYPIGKGVKRMIYLKTVLPWFFIERILLNMLNKKRKQH